VSLRKKSHDGWYECIESQVILWVKWDHDSIVRPKVGNAKVVRVTLLISTFGKVR